MSTTFTWTITNIERFSEYNSLTDVAVAIHWRLEGRDEDNKYAFHYGVQQLDLTRMDPSSFVTYNNITESQAKQWVINELNNENPVSEDESSKGLVFTDILEQHIQSLIDTEDNRRLTGTPW